MEVTNSPKKILYVITKANWGGAQRYVFDMAIAARNAGDTVAVAFGTPGRLAERLEEEHITTLPLGRLTRDINAHADSTTFLSLIRVIKEYAPDVVHANSSKAGLLAVIAARISGVPQIIFTAHGWAFNESRPLWQKLMIALLHYITVVFSDTTICVSYAVQRDAWWMPFVQRRLRVIHNGVSPVTYLEQNEARKILAPQSTASLWVGTIAELHPTKQLHVAIEAFAAMGQEFPQAVYIIMGEGEERERLEKLIIEKNMTGRIILCGHTENASQYLKALDIFVLPSLSEGLAYVVLEAGDAELPVVASRVGGIPEIINSPEYGLLVASGDVTAFKDAFYTLLSDTSQRELLGSALHERVATEFSTIQMTDATRALY